MQKNTERERLKHPIAPVVDKDSRILILGSFPSVASRGEGFFYGHKSNRFWRILAEIAEREVPRTKDEKTELLAYLRIALWDVLSECEIKGSDDSTIRDAKPNDIDLILSKAKIEKIFVNGKTAKEYYDKYLKEKTGMEAHALPSSSPRNAAYSLDRLVDEWKIIKIV